MSLEIVGDAIELQGSPFSQAPTIKLYIKKKKKRVLCFYFHIPIALFMNRYAVNCHSNRPYINCGD